MMFLILCMALQSMANAGIKITKSNGGKEGYKYVTTTGDLNHIVLTCKDPGYESCSIKIWGKDFGKAYVTKTGMQPDELTSTIQKIVQIEVDGGNLSGTKYFPELKLTVSWNAKNKQHVTIETKE